MRKLMKVPLYDNFELHAVASFDGSPTQLIDVAILAQIKIDGRRTPQVPLLVLNMKHDIIIGRKFFKYFKVALDPKNRRLIYPDI